MAVFQAKSMVKQQKKQSSKFRDRTTSVSVFILREGVGAESRQQQNQSFR